VLADRLHAATNFHVQSPYDVGKRAQLAPDFSELAFENT
jgi:hypothetical protein